MISYANVAARIMLDSLLEQAFGMSASVAKLPGRQSFLIAVSIRGNSRPYTYNQNGIRVKSVEQATLNGEPLNASTNLFLIDSYNEEKKENGKKRQKFVSLHPKLAI